MQQRCRWRVGFFAVAVLLTAVLLVRTDSSASLAEQPPADGFTPVAPAPAINEALRWNLKITRDWVNDKDYTSAHQTANGVLVLAQLYGYQSTQPAFREKVAALGGLCDRLGKATKAKDETASQKALDECEALLAELARAAPPNDRTTDKDFKPVGSTKTWMLLVDGTYSDAKAAKDPKQLEHYAYTIAEGCNAMAHLRTDPRWRQESLAVRDAALQAAQKARAGELGPAREALKVVYQTCESCHQRYKKK